MSVRVCVFFEQTGLHQRMQCKIKKTVKLQSIYWQLTNKRWQMCSQYQIYFRRFKGFWTVHHSINLYQSPTSCTNSLFHNHICYTIFLNMFRVSLCSSSGGTKIVCLQYLVSSHSVSCSGWDSNPQSQQAIVTIPDTVDIQFSFLLRMSTSMLETCWGI